MRDRSQTLRLDPGWLFVIAGLAICVSGVLVPAQDDLETLRAQLERLREREASTTARLEAGTAFLEKLDHNDPALIRRLAAAQLNLVPAGHKPVLLAASRRASVTDWIDESLRPSDWPAQRPGVAPKRTMLSRLTGGPHRLWVLGAGMLSVFVGLIVDGGGAAGETPSKREALLNRVGGRLAPRRPNGRGSPRGR